MLTRILVPLDGTAEAAAALPTARVLSDVTGARVALVRVARRAESTAAHAYLQRVSAGGQAGGEAITTLVRNGDPAREIAAAARTWSADLLLMSTHGRVGLRRVVLGSVAEQLLGSTSLPLMLIRPGGRRMAGLKRILVPVDGTPGGAVALGAAVNLAKQTGARLQLLEVVVPIPYYAYAMSDADLGYLDTVWEEEARAGASTYVSTLARRLTRTGIATDGDARVGPVAKTIATTASQLNADVIVMSTHGLTGPARAILGSVTDEVVRTARQPILIVRRATVKQHRRPAA